MLWHVGWIIWNSTNHLPCDTRDCQASKWIVHGKNQRATRHPWKSMLCQVSARTERSSSTCLANLQMMITDDKETSWIEISQKLFGFMKRGDLWCINSKPKILKCNYKHSAWRRRSFSNLAVAKLELHQIVLVCFEGLLAASGSLLSGPKKPKAPTPTLSVEGKGEALQAGP